MAEENLKEDAHTERLILTTWRQWFEDEQSNREIFERLYGQCTYHVDVNHTPHLLCKSIYRFQDDGNIVLIGAT